MTTALPLAPEAPEGSHKKVIYFVRHAEALHNVKEREAVQAAIASGEMNRERQQDARRAVLSQDASLRDAPLSHDGTHQARSSSKKLHALFGSGAAPFRRPQVVLVSPLRRALMTATQLFYDTNTGGDPPLFLAVEALREKRTGLACDERSSVVELQAEFPHVDFTDVQRGWPPVPVGEDNEAVRARAAAFLDQRLASIPGTHLALVSHKGYLREQRHVLHKRVQSGKLRADFDVQEWDKTLYGNAEVRVAALRWQDGELISVVSRSVDNAMLASAAMVGDGFEFAIGPPSSGFSIFLANRTTKVHFISLAEGRHNVAIRQVANDMTSVLPNGTLEDHTDDVLVRHPDQPASAHPLYDARLTTKGAQQADKLRQMLAQRPSGGRPFTAFDLVVVSPLTRACETAQHIFKSTPGTYGGVVLSPPRILVKEECRERFGKYVCDGRRPLSNLMQEFSKFDFSEITSNEDELHTDTRESGTDIRARALQLLNWLSDRPERCIAVVTHTEFLRFLFGQFGDTLDDEDRGCLQRRTENCELRSVVLCSHGAAQREGKNGPASTIRVPSSSSLSSLTRQASQN